VQPRADGPARATLGLAVGLQAVMSAGDGAAMIVLAARILQVSHESWTVAVVFLAITLPITALAPAAGLVLDRLPARPVLVTAAAATAAIALALSQLTSVAATIALAGAFGVCAAVLQPGLGAIVPRLAGRVGVTRANSYLQAATWTGFTAGPLLAGLLIATGGFAQALIADAALYALGTAGLAVLRLAPTSLPAGTGIPDTAPAGTGRARPAEPGPAETGPAGMRPAWRGPAGPSRIETGSAGAAHREPGSLGTGPVGTGLAGPGRAETGPAETDRAETGPLSPIQMGTGPGGTGPAGTGPAGTGPAGTGPVGAGPGETGPGGAGVVVEGAGVAGAGSPAPLGEQLRAGFSYLRGDPDAGILVLIVGLMVAFTNLAVVAEVVFAERVLGSGASGYSVLVAGWTAGMVVGTLLGGRLPRRRLVAAALAGTAVAGAGMALAGATVVLWQAATAYGLGGLGDGIEIVATRSFLNHRVPGPVAGRVFALYSGVLFGASSVGMAAAAGLLGVLGPRGVLWVAGGGGLATGIAGAVIMARRARRAARRVPAAG
jgi:MFS family permease